MAEKKLNRRVDPDTEIIVMNNVKGSFFYRSQGDGLVLDLDHFGDEEYVTFGDLKKMMKRKRVILEKLKLIIVDVDSEEYTVDDVVAALRLTDTYNELKSITDGEIGATGIEEFILNSESEDLERLMASKKSKLKNTILETAVELYRKGRLSDYNKMRTFAKYTGGKYFADFWKDAELPEGLID